MAALYLIPVRDKLLRAGLPSFELADSYRYLYRMNVNGRHVAATDELDTLIEDSLAVAAWQALQ
ncbi:hypothetical protein AB8810_22495 [Xanthomonas sp. NCPPB 3005]|jgi:hypothetical protein|uniref:hypothetical protein n=1 Tax=Xanthomonas sp. NCPPB 3005 TaxID=3240913 RepID=UPI003513E460